MGTGELACAGEGKIEGRQVQGSGMVRRWQLSSRYVR